MCILYISSSKLDFIFFYVYRKWAIIHSKIYWEMWNIVMHLILLYSSSYSQSSFEEGKYPKFQSENLKLVPTRVSHMTAFQAWALNFAHVLNLFDSLQTLKNSKKILNLPIVCMWHGLKFLAWMGFMCYPIFPSVYNRGECIENSNILKGLMTHKWLKINPYQISCYF